MNKDYILHKYLNDEASKEEIAMLENDAAYKPYIKISEASKQFETPEFNSENTLNAIQSKIQPKEVKVKPIFSKKVFLRIAAVIALLVTSYLFLENKDTSISTDVAQKEHLILPDQSEISLNALSSITYNKKDWTENRNLELDGEAYFKVKKGSTFNVNTSQGTVTVLGTQFNVFSRNNQFDIRCYEGLVSVAFNNETIKVSAGNYITIKDSKLINNTTLEMSSPSWINNESSFENAIATDVFLELERQYPIKVKYKTAINKLYTGSFTHTNLTVALRSICDPLQLDFAIANDEVTLYAKNSN